MKSSVKDSKTTLSKRPGILGIGLCALCCALPIIGTATGIGVLSSIAVYFKKAGLIILVISLGAWAVWFVRRRQVIPVCDIDCACKTAVKFEIIK